MTLKLFAQCLQYSEIIYYFLCRYEVGNRRKIRNKKDGEMSKLKYKVKKERKVSILNNVVRLSVISYGSF